LRPNSAQPTTGYVNAAHGIRLYHEIIGVGPQTVVIPNGLYYRDDFRRLVQGRTLIFYDLRNRGLSDPVSNPELLAGGIHNDVEDLEAVRLRFGIDEMALIGHSYVGLTTILYAMKYGAHVSRIVQLSPVPPFAGKQYPAHLTANDGVLQEVSTKLWELEKLRGSESAVEFCKRFWSVLRTIYVFNPEDAAKIDHWGRCDAPNELNFMKCWTESVLPSINALRFTPEEFAKVRVPVLTIHGTRDRSAAYGGARDWALLLPNARLVSLERTAHAPWIEEPEKVFPAINTFLTGAWPQAAERVASIDSP
jgi:proline iminopeptidase